MDSSPNYGKSKPTNSPTTPIHSKKEKPGPFNPTGSTSASLVTELTAFPMVGVFGQKNNSLKNYSLKINF